jgi:hypothetical protein
MTLQCILWFRQHAVEFQAWTEAQEILWTVSPMDDHCRSGLFSSGRLCKESERIMHAW